MAPDPARFLLATRSPDKAGEIRRILQPAQFPLVTLDEAGVAPTPEEDAIEVFDSFTQNARAKARFFAGRTGLPTLADDSGICVDALEGLPGVRSRRFAGASLKGRDLDRANNERLLLLLRAVPAHRRTARYLCAAAFAQPDGASAVALGTVDGIILDAPRGSAGFGYDPLFFLPQLEKTFAEIDANAKHRVSHRGRAFRALNHLLASMK